FLFEWHLVGVELIRERVERLTAAVHAVALLDPTVEARAEASRSVPTFRHRAGRGGSDGCRISHVVLEPGGRHPARHLYARAFGEPPTALLEQQVEISLPAASAARLCRPHEFGGTLHRIASLAEGIHRPGEAIHVGAL